MDSSGLMQRSVMPGFMLGTSYIRTINGGVNWDSISSLPAAPVIWSFSMKMMILFILLILGMGNQVILYIQFWF